MRSEHRGADISLHRVSVSFGCVLRIEVDDLCSSSLFSCLRASILFSTVAVPVCRRSSGALTPFFSDGRHFSRREIVTCAFRSAPWCLVISNIFSCTFHVYSLEKCLFRSSAQSLIGLFGNFLLLSSMSSLFWVLAHGQIHSLQMPFPVPQAVYSSC